MHKLHRFQARGINKSMRIPQKYNTKQAPSHTIGTSDITVDIQLQLLSMRHWMFSHSK